VPRYALLLRASGNRVYGEAAPALATAELGVLGRHAVEATSIDRASIAGVDYLVLEVEAGLDDDATAVLATLSGLHAAYAIDDDGRFRPVPLHPRRYLDEDIVTIQRYPGKTNEAFAHLLVNVGLAAGDTTLRRWLEGERLRLLDPVCGRGSTLNRAALLGIDAYGIEVDRREVAAYETFLTTWLKDKRLKHAVARATMRKGRPVPAHRLTITYGASKDRATHRTIEVVTDDSRSARDHHKARSVDLLVGDLPYGVQHGAREGDARSRGPETFLADALPVWRDVLRPGGGLALAFNRRTLRRADLVDLAASAGLDVSGAGDDGFVHRVDRSITRDVLVGRRPTS
jgi:SAM-dependent methyltransferase